MLLLNLFGTKMFPVSYIASIQLKHIFHLHIQNLSLGTARVTYFVSLLRRTHCVDPIIVNSITQTFPSRLFSFADYLRTTRISTQTSISVLIRVMYIPSSRILWQLVATSLMDSTENEFHILLHRSKKGTLATTANYKTLLFSNLQQGMWG